MEGVECSPSTWHVLSLLQIIKPMRPLIIIIVYASSHPSSLSTRRAMFLQFWWRHPVHASRWKIGFTLTFSALTWLRHLWSHQTKYSHSYTQFCPQACDLTRWFVLGAIWRLHNLLFNIAYVVIKFFNNNFLCTLVCPFSCLCNGVIIFF